MINNNNGTEPVAFTCPYCKKELPEELSFCPYCMERIKKAAVITPPQKKKNKIIIPLIALFISILIITLMCLMGIIFAINSNRQANSPAQTTENTTGTINETGNIKKEETLTENEKTPVKVNGTVNESNNQSSDTIPYTKQNEKETANTPTSQATTKSNKINNRTTAPEPAKVTQAPVTVATTKESVNTITVEQMAGRWNKANAGLNIYNFQLSGYTSQNHGDSCTISQSFNNSGVNMNFTFNKNLDSYTLKGDNVANLNSMYQICRVSLKAVAGNKYNDSSFYDFVSSDNWKETSSNTQTKTGNFAGYNCKLTLIAHENTDQWGLTYTRYSFTLTATKI